MNREEKKRETRKRIIDAALQLFSEHGYEATTVAQITDLAGVGKGTFFNYFDSKETIMCDLQGFWAIDEIMKLREHPGPYVPRIKEMLVELVYRMQLNRPLVKVMLQGTLTSPFNLANQNEILHTVYEAATPIVQLAQERGEFNDKYSPEIITQMTVQAFFGCLLFWAMEQGEEKLADQMKLTMELFFAGVTE
ncbi:MAG: TetR/AcrR family transcriptional regulator [Paenibacillus sp.]|jgi:AcrR family transcriptional regulator|nr:TetR/AcrR family transcriptional regulator [Paenibacillus sp.]